MHTARPLSSPVIYAYIALVATALVAIRLSSPAVLHDRGFYLHGAWVLDAVQNGHWICPRNHTGEVTSKPPLYLWLAGLATLASDRISLCTMVLPSAMATLALAWLIWGFGRAVFGTPAGLLGALAYLLSYVGATQIALARPDGVFALTVTAAALTAYRAWTTGRGWTWCWLLAAAATLTKGPLGLVLASTGLLAVVWEKQSGHPLPLRGSQRLGVALFVVCTAGWFVLAYMAVGQALIDKMIFRELLRHAVTGSEATRSGHTLFIQPLNFLWSFAPWSLLAGLGGWRACQRPAVHTDERRAERFLCCWLWTGLLLFSLAPHQQERHLFPLIPAAALLSGRELARLAAAMPPRALLGTCAIAVAAGLGIIAVSYHLFMQDNERVRRAQGMQEMARVIQERIGNGFVLTHVETPFSLQFFLNTLVPLTTPQQAAHRLSSADTAFVAVRDLEALQELLMPQPFPLYVVARWPATGEAEVWVVSNRRLSEWTPYGREDQDGPGRGNY